MSKSRFNVIVAVSDDNVIGVNGAMPWPFLRQDIERFKSQTQGNIVIMGRGTWLSLPQHDLKNKIVAPNAMSALLSSTSSGSSLLLAPVTAHQPLVDSQPSTIAKTTAEINSARLTHVCPIIGESFYGSTISRALPKRQNYVLTRKPKCVKGLCMFCDQLASICVMHSLDEALEVAAKEQEEHWLVNMAVRNERSKDHPNYHPLYPRMLETWVIGGAELYETAIKHPLCEQVWVTRVRLNLTAKATTTEQFVKLDIDRLLTTGPFLLSEESLMQKQRDVSFVFQTFIRCKTDDIKAGTGTTVDGLVSGGPSCNPNAKNMLDRAASDKLGISTAYRQLIKHILENGIEQKEERTGTGCRMVWCHQARFNLLGNRLPLDTLKFTPHKLILKELLFFLSGSKDASALPIWKGNTTREFLDSRGLFDEPVGSIGRGYGFQWRKFGEDEANGKPGVDQISLIEQQIRQVIANPSHECGRRIILMAWNPAEIHLAALPPCHIGAQWWVENGKYLRCVVMMRSSDVALGWNFNANSYTLLTHMFAHVTGLEAKELVLSTHHTHIYSDHVEALRNMIETRKECPDPIIRFNPAKKFTSINDFKETSDIEVVGYKFHPKIDLEMAV